MKVVVIGGGAAGFFAALSVKEHHPKSTVSIFEKSQKVLAKVRISGGGRCNVTNGSDSIAHMTKSYPRGGKFLKSGFKQWMTVDTQQWFEERGVPLYTQDDHRVFPKSNDSQSIIDCLMNECEKNDIKLCLGHGVLDLERINETWQITLKDKVIPCDKVIIATGGSPKLTGFDWLQKTNHQIIAPVPSLFTFNIPNHSIIELMGQVAPTAMVHIQGTKLKSGGPLLITHWGMSGPAVLKLSALAARYLNELGYKFKVQINWLGIKDNGKVYEILQEALEANTVKPLEKVKPFEISKRLWEYFILKADLNPSKASGELGRKSINRLVSVLCNDEYQVEGKTTFKEEFVTSGGIELSEINPETMKSRLKSGLYFAGEIMNIDGITGGYNFQAAWTTGYIAGKLK